jgi:hypothetical protein
MPRILGTWADGREVIEKATSMKKKKERRGRKTSPMAGELGWPTMAWRPEIPTVAARARV